MTDRNETAYLIRKNQEIRVALRDAFLRGVAHAERPGTEKRPPEAEAVRLYPDFDPKELTL